jgi:hypothetical protein
MSSAPSAISATALEPAPLLGISEPVVHVLCDDTAHAVALREAYGKRRIDLISGGAGNKTHLLRHLTTPLAVPGPNDLYSEVDYARLMVLDALRSAEDDDNDQRLTVMAAAFCVNKFCLAILLLLCSILVVEGHVAFDTVGDFLEFLLILF